MDTRSKKFDRSLISKTIAFLLAIVCFAVSFVNAVDWFAQTKGIDQRSNIVSDYMSNFFSFGESLKIENTVSYGTEYANAVVNAVIGFNTYGDGSKAAYNKYQAERKQYFSGRDDDLVKKVTEDCLGTTGRGNPFAILGYIQRYRRHPFISLEKIADHEKHYTNATVTMDSSGVIEIYDENDDSYIYDYDLYNNGEGVTMAKRVYVDSDFYTDAYNKESPNEIPKSIAAKAKKGSHIVELCDFNTESTGYDGYYLLTFNEENIKNSAGNSDLKYRNSFESYSDFHDGYKAYRERLLALKNLKIAVVDNQTKAVSSNVKELDGTKASEKVASYFKSFEPSNGWRSVDFSKGNGEEPGRYNYEYFITDFGVIESELYSVYDCTLYTVLDSSLSSGEDVFSGLQNDLTLVGGIVRNIFKTGAIGIAIAFLCIIYLIIRSGRKSGDDELHLMYTDRVFTLIRTAINAGLIYLVGFGCLALADEMIHGNAAASIFVKSVIGVLAAVTMAIFIDWLLFIARHIKNGTLFKNLFIVWAVSKINALVKKEEQRIKEKPVIYQDIMNDVLKRVLLMGFLPNLVIGIIITMWFGCDAFELAFVFIFLLFAYDIFLTFYICRYAYSAREVIQAVNQIRSGNNDITINTEKMPNAVKSFANDVMSLNEGLKIAVAKAVKDQRMKTELITNVSHDLKTPLTSIINYVDLLSRCEIEDETAKGYIEVLGEKSARLKKLIEDLVEASKASSGAMRVDLVSVSLNELSAQVAGEYEEEFEKRRLELICESESDDIIVRADSKLSYRILDNLLGNVKKYAMPGTRVYMTLSKSETGGILTIRNISQSRLNIPVSELLERFVRADESRSTEGSGLGLSIADNLCSLQGAKLELEINGDLFTARVIFPLWS